MFFFFSKLTVAILGQLSDEYFNAKLSVMSMLKRYQIFISTQLIVKDYGIFLWKLPQVKRTYMLFEGSFNIAPIITHGMLVLRYINFHYQTSCFWQWVYIS